MTHQLLLAGMMVVAGSFLLVPEAPARSEQNPFVVAQAGQNDPRRRQQQAPQQAPRQAPAIQPRVQQPTAQPTRPQPPAPPAVQQRVQPQQRLQPQPRVEPGVAQPGVQPRQQDRQPRRVQPQEPAVRPARPAVEPVRPSAQPPSVQPVGPAGRQRGQQPEPRGAQPAVQPRLPAVSVRPAVGRIENLRDQRREERRGNSVFIREPGRTIERAGNRAIIRRDDTARLRLRSSGTRVERRGNQTFTYVDRPNGVRIINVVDGNGRLIRRIRRDRNGREVVIINNRRRAGIALGALGVLAIAAPAIAIPPDRYVVEAEAASPALLYDTLTAPPVEPLERAYGLDEVLYTANLRDRMPRIDIDTITFDTGSWEVTPEQAAKLGPLAEAMKRAIEQNPNEIYLIEGHTDGVGNEVDNLSLSDRRAEAVAIVLSEQYGIPPENLTTQGYGEEYLKVPTQDGERRNRRVTVRRITPLLAGGEGPQSEDSPPETPQGATPRGG